MGSSRYGNVYFCKKILNDKPIKVFNHGKMMRNFTYIDDIINGLLAAIDKNYKCEVFNLGNNKSEDLMDVVKIIQEKLGKKANIQYKPMQLGDVEKTFADIDKSRKMLGFNPKTNIAKGIGNFIDWLQEFYNYK